MKRLVPFLLCAFLFTNTSCESVKGSLNRAGKDLFIVAASPGILPYGASTDAAVDARTIQEGLGANEFWQVAFFPFTFAYRSLDHGFSIGIHAVDFLASPFYILADANNFGPDIKPLQIYSGTIFDPDPSADEGDVETGEGK